MPPRLKPRRIKPFTDLTADDFLACQIWVHLGGPDADATVEPRPAGAISDDDQTVYLAATDFRLSDGTCVAGFCSPADHSGLDYVQPVIFGPNGHVALWRPGMGAATPKLVAQELGKSVTQVFPIEWHCKVTVDAESREGKISEAELVAG